VCLLTSLRDSVFRLTPDLRPELFYAVPTGLGFGDSFCVFPTYGPVAARLKPRPFKTGRALRGAEAPLFHGRAHSFCRASLDCSTEALRHSEYTSVLGYAAEFGYSAGFDPFDYEDVAVVIEAGAVRADETAGG
jgi:hypothetical protein